MWKYFQIHARHALLYHKEPALKAPKGTFGMKYHPFAASLWHKDGFHQLKGSIIERPYAHKALWIL